MFFKFEQLKVWQMSLELTAKIDKFTKTFPKEELFVLTSQIKRAADSISLNIAEGSTGQTDRELSRFLSFAIRSGIEVVSCLYLAKKRELIKKEEFEIFYNEFEKLIIMLQALRRSLNKNNNDPEVNEPISEYLQSGDSVDNGLSTVDYLQNKIESEC